ncbi:DUF4157 domain-containing protein [Aquimarina sp. 2201CG1-2-11]|uniref:eCIS core domain-containing protein n=1 Tax=Aquimarina discodermiae TaxID=3231043 RepID=UPI00346203E5
MKIKSSILKIVSDSRAKLKRWLGKTDSKGLPRELRLSIEKLSGMSMHDVTVHYNSDKPALIQAHAYAQGTEIYLAPGQERYLPHEAWHIVQQKQGRVAPLFILNGKFHINDDIELEAEADMMGAKAQQLMERYKKHKKKFPLFPGNKRLH